VSSNVDVPRTTVSAGRPWWLDLLLTRSPGPLRSRPARAVMLLVIVVGAGLTVYSGYIHLYLWGRQPYPYSSIPTIGPLFLLQGIVGVLLGVLVVIARRLFAVLLAAGFMVVSAAALVIDVEVGLFGFQDSWAAPYVTGTLRYEIVGAVLLLLAAGVLAWTAVAGRSRRGR
jgi:hypothetical protein